jgi:hypothetical protein
MATLTIPANQTGDGGIPTMLDTDLNISPYFDDFDATKQYYKVLFKPGTAVQVRELNQLQTILQNQIASFGQNIYKEGSVIKGCAFTFDNAYNYVKLSDTYSNTTALTITDLQGLIVKNAANLQATIVNTLPGLVSDGVNLNTIYIKYRNSALYSNGSQQSTFDPGETLSFYTEAGISQGNVVAATVSNTTGLGYAFTTTSGIIFKKGYFIYVAPQTAVISKYTNIPDNISVGFEAIESLVTSNADETLFDNAAGSPNYTAPGADRLKITPTLITKTTSDINKTTFFSLVDFKSGQPITIRNDTQFNSVTLEEAKRTFETSGNFVVYPFDVSTKTIADTTDPDYATHFNTIIGKGIGYVEGHRVEFINSNAIKTRRGTDYAALPGQRVSLNLGYYALVNELSGNFNNSTSIIEVELHNVSKKALSTHAFTAGVNGGYSSTTKIGTAYIKSFVYDNGVQGTFDCQYRLYLFNDILNDGYSFNDVRSIIYYDGSVKAVADIVLTYNGRTSSYYADINSSTLKTMLFPFGQKAIKSDGFGSINFNYRNVGSIPLNASLTANAAGQATITIPGGVSYNDTYYYGSDTTLSSSQMNDVIVIPTSNSYSRNKTGSVQYWDSVGIAITANTNGVNSTADTIKMSNASNRFRPSDKVYYAVPTGNTAVGGLTGNTYYYVSFANSTDIALSTGTGGPNLNIFETRTGAGETHTFTGNVGYIYACTATSFSTDYANGDFIIIDSTTIREIVSIANDVFMQVDAAFDADVTNKNHQKAFPAGVPIPFGNRPARSMNVDSSGTILTINLGETVNTSFTVQVDAAINRAGAKPITKQINKGIYVKIDCSSHPNKNIGPWSLGLPDVLSIDSVYIGSGTYAEGTNYLTNFTLDNGQRESHYDLASLVLKNGSFGLSKTATILVKLSAFSYPSGEGKGFFTANSYPISDVATSSTITILDIPTFTTKSGNFYDLRNVVDFRPYATNTAVITTVIGSATPVNPSSTLTFSTTPYLPKPDSLFLTDVENYLYRTDRVMLDINGNVIIKEGLPSTTPNPPPPIELPKTMTLSVLSIPPYPSLTSNEARSLSRYDNAILSKVSQQRRYTMKDISGIDNRIKNLEYYTSLSVLEQSAAALQVRSSSTGQTRFQNGIFVDGFNGFDLSNTKDASFNISIDGDRTELRPAFFQLRSEFAVDIGASSNVVQAGELVMLKHTSNNLYISQKYASKYRNCIEGNIYNHKGTIKLTPSGATAPSITNNPVIKNNIDLYSNWVNLVNAWGTQWNNWQTISTKATDTLISASASESETLAAGGEGGSYGGTKTTTTTQTLQTTQSIMQAIGNRLSTSGEQKDTLNIGTFLQSASLTPFIPAATIQFEAHGMKPDTIVYAYFNNTNVSAWCAQITADQMTAGYDYLDPKKNQPPYTNVLGTQLKTDSTGYIHGIFSIPNIEGARFEAGELEFKLIDISDLTQGASAITTEADAIYYGRTLTLAQGQSLLNTRSTVISSSEVKSDTFTLNGTGVSTDVTQAIVLNPPPGSGGGGGCGCGCFISSTLVMLASGKEIPINEVKIGDLVYNHDKTTVNTVKFIEVVNDKYFEKLYSPTSKFAPFATVNHPLYFDGELHGVDPDKNLTWYPWLGKNKQIEVDSIVNSSNQLVYNLWVDGDGTYTVNGFGTSSIIGDGGLLRLAVEDGLITEQKAIELMYYYIELGKSTVHGMYLLNKLIGKINNKYVTKFFTGMLVEETIGRKIIKSFAKVVGTTMCFAK